MEVKGESAANMVDVTVKAMMGSNLPPKSLVTVTERES